MVELAERWSCHRTQILGGGPNSRLSADKLQINQYDLTVRPAEKAMGSDHKKIFTLMAHEHSGPFVNGPRGELPLDLLV